MNPSVDAVVVRGGRVMQVHRGSWPPHVPYGAEVVAAPAGAVHPGMLYDGAQRMFLAMPAPAPQYPLSRIALPSGGVPVATAVPALAQAPGAPVSNVNTITVVNQLPGAPMPAVPNTTMMDTPAMVASPGVSSAQPLGEVKPSPSLPPSAATAQSSEPVATGSGMPRDRAVSALRGFQVEAWPPERERYADLAAAFLSYGDPALVPDLAAIVPPGSSLEEVARIALEARDVAQRWVVDIGRLIDAEAPSVVTDEDADRLIARGRAILEGS